MQLAIPTAMATLTKFLYPEGALLHPDSRGNLVFDSGDDFEQITEAQVPALFNSNGTAATFDMRSDNKGPSRRHSAR